MMLSRSTASRALTREIKSSRIKKFVHDRNFSLQRVSQSNRSLSLSKSKKTALFAIADQYNSKLLNVSKSDVLSINRRFSSSLSYEDDVDVDGNFYEKSRKEAWMVNLRGGQDDRWLVGPRDDSWFTGVSPNNACPGTDMHGKIRSLPLPNLSKVTRESALEYFDNSWTLYETLFAGLKGEEPFYR